jgi:hypothetical protein
MVVRILDEDQAKRFVAMARRKSPAARRLLQYKMMWFNLLDRTPGPIWLVAALVAASQTAVIIVLLLDL